MQNEIVQNEIVSPRPRRGFHCRFSQKTRRGLLFLALLAAGLLDAAALNQVLPRPPRARGFLDRVVWYASRGQIRADLHTLAHVVEYVAASETSPATTTVPPHDHLTQNAGPTAPKS
jgi:hypothetical protein